jgi:tetratricopeptide (TPR) repeat protein
VRLLRLTTVALALLVASGAALAQSDDERARQLFIDGKQAFENKEFQKAYDDFKESYRLSHKPPLLYNIASALQGLRRPHDAAEALRDFLRLQPDDPDAPAIVQRIEGLEEVQRILDAERPPSPRPGSTLLVAAPVPPARPRHKTAIVVGVSIAAVALVGIAVGLGVGLTQHGPEPYTPAIFGPMAGTR